LYEFGFGSHNKSVAADDQLELTNCRITNAVKCLPPDNKPVGAEINTCNQFLVNELAALPDNSVLLALGGIAHRAVVKAIGGRQADYKFAHAAEHRIDERLLMLDSYHCSRYNTNTRRLTTPMFREVFARAREILDQPVEKQKQ
jgi:uracil-DNA glycosylase family 4